MRVNLEVDKKKLHFDPILIGGQVAQDSLPLVQEQSSQDQSELVSEASESEGIEPSASTCLASPASSFLKLLAQAIIDVYGDDDKNHPYQEVFLSK